MRLRWLDTTGEAALAVDDEGLIIAWNAGAESLLCWAAQDVVGKPCHEVIQGRDRYGDDDCSTHCLPRAMLERRATVQNFQIHALTATGERIPLVVSTLLVGGPRSAEGSVLHILRPGGEPGSRSEGAEQARPGVPAPVERWDDAPAPTQAPPELTAREIEILRHLDAGQSAVEVGRALFISPATVRTHVQRILRKCEVHSIRQATALARRHGLI